MMKKLFSFVLFFLILTMALSGQMSPAFILYRGLEQDAKGDPILGPKSQYFEVYLDASGRISELRLANGADPGKPKTAFRVSYEAQSCTYNFINNTYYFINKWNGPLTDISMRWSMDEANLSPSGDIINPNEGRYTIKLHREELIDTEKEKKNVEDRTVALIFASKEAEWYEYETESTRVFRWRFSKEVQSSFVQYDNDGLLYDTVILDDKGLYEPDMACSRYEYKKTARGIQGTGYFRYDWMNMPDDTDWMQNDVWIISSKTNGTPNVFTTVLNYLILETYFTGSSISGDTMKYFGHSLFNISLKE
jgi:hypothetical protein